MLNEHICLFSIGYLEDSHLKESSKIFLKECSSLIEFNQARNLGHLPSTKIDHKTLGETLKHYKRMLYDEGTELNTLLQITVFKLSLVTI